MKRLFAPIISNTNIISGVRIIWTGVPEIATLAQPGQFVMVRCGDGYDPLLRRPFSIHQTGNGGKLALLFKVVGKGTTWLSHRREGDYMDLFGPLGKGFSLPSSSANLLLVAGGVGIAPLLFLAQKAIAQQHQVTLLVGATSRAQLYPKSLLPPDIEAIIATEDGSEGQRGMVTELVADFIPWADYIFACGPLSMYQTMAAERKLRNKPVQVSLERRMGCGIGVCYGCTINTRQGLKQVCKDGPVFELEDITNF